MTPLGFELQAWGMSSPEAWRRAGEHSVPRARLERAVRRALVGLYDGALHRLPRNLGPRDFLPEVPGPITLETAREFKGRAGRIIGWLRAVATDYPTVRKALLRSTSERGKASPSQWVHVPDVLERFPSPGKLERLLRKVQTRADLVLGDILPGQKCSWRAILAGCMHSRRVGKAALSSVASHLHRRPSHRDTLVEAILQRREEEKRLLLHLERSLIDVASLVKEDWMAVDIRGVRGDLDRAVARAIWHEQWCRDELAATPIRGAVVQPGPYRDRALALGMNFPRARAFHAADREADRRAVLRAMRAEVRAFSDPLLYDRASVVKERRLGVLEELAAAVENRRLGPIDTVCSTASRRLRMQSARRRQYRRLPTGEYVGWRCWVVNLQRMDDGTWVADPLESPFRRNAWVEPRMSAPYMEPGNRVRDAAGIHAHWIRKRAVMHAFSSGRFLGLSESLRRVRSLRIWVVGRVLAHGQIQAGPEGFRAEHVEIDVLWLPHQLRALAEPLRARYPGLPIRVSPIMTMEGA